MLITNPPAARGIDPRTVRFNAAGGAWMRDALLNAIVCSPTVGPSGTSVNHLIPVVYI